MMAKQPSLSNAIAQPLQQSIHGLGPHQRAPLEHDLLITTKLSLFGSEQSIEPLRPCLREAPYEERV